MFKRGSVSSSGQWMTAADKHNVLGVKRPFFFHADKKKKKPNNLVFADTIQNHREAPDSTFDSP